MGAKNHLVMLSAWSMVLELLFLSYVYMDWADMSSSMTGEVWSFIVCGYVNIHISITGILQIGI
jgi:hypothetical protein